MPITEHRLLALISAGEDALRGLQQVPEILRRETALGATPEATLANLKLFLQPDFLLSRPQETRETLLRERQHMSPTRQGQNRRARLRAQRRRAKQLHEPVQEAEPDFE